MVTSRLWRRQYEEVCSPDCRRRGVGHSAWEYPDGRVYDVRNVRYRRLPPNDTRSERYALICEIEVCQRGVEFGWIDFDILFSRGRYEAESDVTLSILWAKWYLFENPRPIKWRHLGQPVVMKLR